MERRIKSHLDQMSACFSPQPHLHLSTCGMPWPSRRCRCFAVSTPAGFVLSASVPQESCCCLWAWTLNTPSPSGSGRKVKKEKEFSSFSLAPGIFTSLVPSFRCQSGQPDRSHPEDLCGWVSARLRHALCVRGHQARAFLDVSWPSFAQQEGRAQYPGGRPDADHAFCSIWSCKWTPWSQFLPQNLTLLFVLTW